MLPRKLRTIKIQNKILNPQGADLWAAPVVARGIIKTTLKWLKGKQQVEMDEFDCAIIRAALNHIRSGQGFNPISGGAALVGDKMLISAPYLREKLRSIS